mmetsp:Transcript_20934/g.52676  ORF Transcript_20934/g.52676 Transcript_20934/m.52676 type:complete len:715 (+) Transcript_20934:287-2431(+)
MLVGDAGDTADGEEVDELEDPDFQLDELDESEEEDAYEDEEEEAEVDDDGGAAAHPSACGGFTCVDGVMPWQAGGGVVVEELIDDEAEWPTSEEEDNGGHGHSRHPDYEASVVESCPAPTPAACTASRRIPETAHAPDSTQVREDAISRRTRANLSLTSVSIEELEQLLNEPDGGLGSAGGRPDGEYSRFLQFFTGGLDLPEDEDDDEDFFIDPDDLCDEEFNVMEGQNRPRRHPRGAIATLNAPEASLRPLAPKASPLFTQGQYAELYAQITRHTQLLIQVYFLSIYGPSSLYKATMQDRVITCQKVSELLQVLVSTSEQAVAIKSADQAPFLHPCTLNVKIIGEHTAEQMQPTGACGVAWSPVTEVPVRSVLDVAPIRILGNLTETVARNPPETSVFEMSRRSKKTSGLHAPSMYAFAPSEPAGVMMRLKGFFDPQFEPQHISQRTRGDGFTSTEDALLAIGLERFGLQYQNIQRHFLPSKSVQQLKLRVKNSRRIPSSRVARAHAKLRDPLNPDEVSAVRAGLAKYGKRKDRWKLVSSECIPRIPASLLPKYWAAAADGCLDKASHADEHLGAPILNERLQVDFSRVNASGDGFSDSQDPYDGYEDRGPGQPHPDFTGGLVPRSGATEGRHGHRCQRVTVKPRPARVFVLEDLADSDDEAGLGASGATATPLLHVPRAPEISFVHDEIPDSPMSSSHNRGEFMPTDLMKYM